jgi:acetyl esterase/lipase
LSPGRVQLALSALGAFSTLNAGNAVDRHGWPAIALGTCVVRSELPREAAALTVARLLWAWRSGRLRGAAGAAAVAVSAGSVARLLYLHRSGLAADAVLRDALRTALPAVPAPPAVAAERARLELPLPLRVMRARSRYSGPASHAYGPHGAQNLLDVWRRPGRRPDAGAPVLLQVPGGGWLRGDRRGQAYPLMSLLAERGWVCVSMSYRAAPEAPWPAQIEDVKRAIVWIKENIAQHGGDPSFLAVTGGSAGGHLSSLAALTAGDSRFQPGFEDVDTSVQAAVPFYGAYDWVDTDRVGHTELVKHVQRTVVQRRGPEHANVFAAASPMHRVHVGAPPFFVVHGANDTIVPVEQGRAFVHALQRVSQNPVAFAELPHAMHAFDIFGSVRTAATARAVAQFLDAVRAQAGVARPAAP